MCGILMQLSLPSLDTIILFCLFDDDYDDDDDDDDATPSHVCQRLVCSSDLLSVHMLYAVDIVN